MRIALITLAVAALAFIGGIIWIFASKNGINFIPTQQSTSTIKISNETAALEILRSQWKTEDQIKTLEAKIDALSWKSNASVQSSGTVEWTGETTKIIPNSSTGTANIIPISAKFLSKIITKVNLTLEKNNGIFGIYVFDTNTEYSTYSDLKSNISIIASRTEYDTWLKNFQSLDKSVFTTNITKTFPFPSFYVNPAKPDNIVRIVMRVEAQTLLISIPKNKFNEFKTLMTKK